MVMAKPDEFHRDASQVSIAVSRKGATTSPAYVGWLQSDIELSLEAISGTFNVPISLMPGRPPDILRQDEVRVYIGDELVITGYVLAAEPFYRGGDCGMRVMGRARTGDLVRCSAIHKGGQWKNATLLRIAEDICKPFGLQVKLETNQGDPIKDFKIAHGERALDALARAARLRGVLLSSDNAGRVLLTRAGTLTFAAAIVRGQNVISMEGVGSDENRHSRYIAYGQCNTVEDFEVARGLKAQAFDKEMTRYLPLVINADGNTSQKELQTLVEHTVRVRRGHSMGFRYTVEGWTYNGQPWPLGQKVVVYDDVAGLNGAEWLICSVHYKCDLRDGPVTELLIRPVEAYSTDPLQTKVRRRNWGNKGNTYNHSHGPSDGAPD